MLEDQQGYAAGTVASDGGTGRHQHAHLGGREHVWDDERDRGQYRLLADRLVAIAGTGRMLDVACGRGLLVHALRERGADARGFDTSQPAVEAADGDVREHLWVASAIDPLEGRFDLVSMVGLAGRLAPQDVERAIDRVTEVTDRVVFSAGVGEREESPHTAAWAARFAERGFFRSTDVDLTVLSPSAALFERGERTVDAVVRAYEDHLAAIVADASEKRAALVARLRHLEEEVLEARHARLLARDHVVGIEAEIGRQNADIIRLSGDLRRLQGREKRLSARKAAQGKRIVGLQTKLEAARKRNTALAARIRELEASASRPSIARRVAGRLRRKNR